jgi:chromosome segregation ATPase
MSEEDSVSSLVDIIDQKRFDIETDKENKMELFLRNYNNDKFGISIYNNNVYPSKKYELKCTLEQIQNYRFFKIFLNVDEIIRELETKIENSIFIEEDNNINMEITIGLNIINQIQLEIRKKEKTKEEIIEELTNKINQQNEQIENLKKEKEQLKKNNNESNININQLRNDNNNLKDENKQKDEKIKGLEAEIEKIKLNNDKIKNDEINEKDKIIEKLRKEIAKLRQDFNDLEKKKQMMKMN